MTTWLPLEVIVVTTGAGVVLGDDVDSVEDDGEEELAEMVVTIGLPFEVIVDTTEDGDGELVEIKMVVTSGVPFEVTVDTNGDGVALEEGDEELAEMEMVVTSGVPFEVIVDTTGDGTMLAEDDDGETVEMKMVVTSGVPFEVIVDTTEEGDGELVEIKMVVTSGVPFEVTVDTTADAVALEEDDEELAELEMLVTSGVPFEVIVDTKGDGAVLAEDDDREPVGIETVVMIWLPSEVMVDTTGDGAVLEEELTTMVVTSGVPFEVIVDTTGDGVVLGEDVDSTPEEEEESVLTVMVVRIWEPPEVIVDTIGDGVDCPPEDEEEGVTVKVVRIWLPSELTVDTTVDGAGVDSASLLVAVDSREDDTEPVLVVVGPMMTGLSVAAPLVDEDAPEEVSTVLGPDAEEPVVETDLVGVTGTVETIATLPELLTVITLTVSKEAVAEDDNDGPVDVPAELSGVPVDEVVCSPVVVVVLSPYEDEMGSDSVDVTVETTGVPPSPVNVKVITTILTLLPAEVVELIEAPLVDIVPLSELGRLEVVIEAVETPVELLEDSVALPEVEGRAEEDETGKDSVEVMVETAEEPPGPVMVLVITITLTLASGEVAGLVEIPLVDTVALSELVPVTGDGRLEVVSEAVAVPAEELEDSVPLPGVGNGAGEDEILSGNDSVEVIVESAELPPGPVMVLVITIMLIPLSEEVVGLVEAPLVDGVPLSELEPVKDDGRLEVVSEAVATLVEKPEEMVLLPGAGNGTVEDEMVTGNDSVDVMVEVPPLPVTVKVITRMLTLTSGEVAGLLDVPLVDPVVLPKVGPGTGGGTLLSTVGLIESVEAPEKELFGGETKGGTGVVTTGGPVVVLLTGPGAVLMLSEEVTLEVCPLLLEGSVPVVSGPVGEVDNEPETVPDVVEARVSLSRSEVYVVETVLPETVMTDVTTMMPPSELVVPVGPYEVDVPPVPVGPPVVVVLDAGKGAVELPGPVEIEADSDADELMGTVVC